MFRKFAFALVIVFCYAVPSLSQDDSFRRVEIFGGYSYLRTDVGDDGRDEEPGINDGSENLNGFHAQAAVNVNRYFGVVGDVSGHYKKFKPEEIGGVPTLGGRSVGARASIHTLLFGPQFKARTRRVTPFAHALLGISRADTSLTDEIFSFPNSRIVTTDQDETKFAFVFGGGVDVNVSDRIAIRAIQADYLRTRFGSEMLGSFPGYRQNNIRLSTGIVFK